MHRFSALWLLSDGARTWSRTRGWRVYGCRVIYLPLILVSLLNRDPFELLQRELTRGQSGWAPWLARLDKNLDPAKYPCTRRARGGLILGLWVHNLFATGRLYPGCRDQDARWCGVLQCKSAWMVAEDPRAKHSKASSYFIDKSFLFNLTISLLKYLKRLRDSTIKYARGWGLQGGRKNTLSSGTEKGTSLAPVPKPTVQYWSWVHLAFRDRSP